MKNRKTLSAFLVAITLAAALAFNSVAAAYAYPEDSNYSKYKNYYSVTHVPDEVLDGYFDKISPEIDELIDLYVKHSLYNLTEEEAILAMLKKFLEDYSNIIPYMGNALLQAFDDFGGYYPNTSVGELFSGNVYSGYGIIIEASEIIDARLYSPRVKHVIRNSPAESAGFQPGDEFVAINGINVEDLGLEAVSNLMAVTKGKTKFTLRRNDEEVTIEVMKSSVTFESVSYEIIDESEKIALLKIENFIDDTMILELSAILGVLDEGGYKNLIIDLRNNQGGSLEYLYEALDCFVTEENANLGFIEMNDGRKEEIFSTDYGFDFDKICVLTNKNTASAAEAFALALYEITESPIIGETTFGKGIGQAYFELANGDIVGITSLELISPKGSRYHREGIEPNIPVDMIYVSAEKKIEDEEFEQLNFVNCLDIKPDADNNAVLALNQRLAKIGYLKPADISSKCTQKTITAVEIFQSYYSLPKGIDKINYNFLEYLSYCVTYTPTKTVDGDAQLECAVKLMVEGEQAAKDFAATVPKNQDDKEVQENEDE